LAEQLTLNQRVEGSSPSGGIDSHGLSVMTWQVPRKPR
jgi:hypothetical protein